MDSRAVEQQWLYNDTTNTEYVLPNYGTSRRCCGFQRGFSADVRNIIKLCAGWQRAKQLNRRCQRHESYVRSSKRTSVYHAYDISTFYFVYSSNADQLAGSFLVHKRRGRYDHRMGAHKPARFSYSHSHLQSTQKCADLHPIPLLYTKSSRSVQQCIR